ncbi:tRNA (guanosine(18)-2'-O)-methyltransferase TrmH [Halioxenophilus aromaticivorans]|uniref:tRNA (guanosine(18)-2'-O)-methyltransferase n=1 Tax=Halioxenophilus aromaticivorans TaxID=1306992 RepID=A0AAV3TXY5_9ALTE
MTPERYQRLLQTLRLRQPDLTVITDEVHKGRNLSAIVRTCDAVGIDTVHTVVPQGGYRGFRGTASGSHKWVEVETYADIHQPVEQLRQRGFQIVATAISPKCKNYLDIDYTKSTALMLGSEKRGVSEQGLSVADEHISVPMIGMVESLNVSVAAAIILQEAFRQRQEAGLYGTNRLSAEIQTLRFFRWAHPKVAEYCDQKGLPYPAIRESDGEIIDPSSWYKSVK